MMRTKHWLRVGLMASLIPLGACGDILEVESPGKIADADLNDPDAIPGLIVGMSHEMAETMGDGTGGLSEFSALAAGELFHGGSYDWADIPRGEIEDDDVDGVWGTLHQTRWVAEDGIRRIQEEILTAEEFSRNPYVARAYLFAGIANRTLGELLCETAIDGGPAEPHTVHFGRAEEQLTQAITIGQAAGGVEDVVTAAYAARASVRAWQGDWAGAVQDAQQVPVDFEYLALLNTEDPSNILYYETHDRFEYSVYGTEFAEHPDDPRAPWEIALKGDGTVDVGANGSTPHYQQEKYSSFGSDVPLVKGTEMLVLRAEAALRNDDIAGAVALMNEARAFYGMDPLPASASASIDAAWDALHYERGATLWLENRRLWDLRRWYNESGPAHHGFMEGRDMCIPISEEEKRANPNID